MSRKIKTLVWLMVAGCSSPPANAARASSCRERGLTIIDNAKTCQEAAQGLDRLVVADPDCVAVFGPAVSGSGCRDGGAK